jgi:hypothetical protein
MKVVDSVGHLLPAYQFGRFFSSPAKLEEGLMKHKKVGESRSEYLMTVPCVWIEGDSPMPSTHQITAWEAPINILFAEVFGKARNASEAMRIDNALSTRRWKLKIAPPIVMLGFGKLARNDVPNGHSSVIGSSH